MCDQTGSIYCYFRVCAHWLSNYSRLGCFGKEEEEEEEEEEDGDPDVNVDDEEPGKISTFQFDDLVILRKTPMEGLWNYPFLT